MPQHNLDFGRRLPACHRFPAAAGLVCLVALHAAAAPVKHSPNEVLLVSNSNSPTSVAVAAYYQGKRGITNTVTVQCADSSVSADNETIDINSYTSEIQTPIANYLATHPNINFIVLTKGIPLRISGAATGAVQKG